ncbi:UDP-glucuronosyl/UDP-glucosyltransferase [Lasiodiplodia theobromae]|uniref:Sterol 3-beta-glucosyltransferase UGT80B1 n=1 Tax=Lasiodiplodia theobromae TaxID=45133 RepID=A0A5N5DSL6_9PEZI|nr:UDP-glucuronosyl/UDP-glucosyltransferase [Lasiodiplodia theobromae]KAB2580955.1 Sterol 3-beta-glucosyltransferase UGT80B1 [Lasiodiplodia theobromae]KAF4542343.1 UDP-glucuronosyl/UDP-glucosyltransferase [Lasiodiplodia theobromae]
MASAPPPGDPQAATAEPNPLSQAAEAIAAAEQENELPSRRPTRNDASLSRASTGASHQAQDSHAVPDAIAEDPPPPYSETLGNIADDGELGTQATVADDGRVNIRIDQKNRRLSTLLVPALRSQLDVVAREPALPAPYVPPSLGGDSRKEPPPPLNIVIQVVGSRGDVQPFVALGKVLKETYHHRIRLATHPTFKKFVEENGLEFFSIGGDPAELMAFMVKNPGLMPGFDTLRNGDVGKRRKGIAEIIDGCWRSCIESEDGFGVDSEQRTEAWVNSANHNPEMPANTTGRPFVADAIIANPPSFAHVHCAEKLGIPLHMMFTMPWSPTQAFPHPLANIMSTNADASLTNYLSYALVDMLTWQGLGDIINRFRQRTLHLEPVSSLAAPGMLHRMRIPYTYCWSPALIPKPQDWANFISISGFYFLSLASNYTPDPELAAFLEAGPPPVYIGFGSIVVDDPNGMTRLIFDAVKKSGVRALVSKGWGGFGADELGIPEGVFMLGNVPHDWLFKHVSCVVHHGGAGTTSAGIACGKPTVVVPFFGDQPFWGAMVARAGAGPEPIPYKQLTSDKLAEAIQFCLKPTSQERAQELAAKISQEKGCDVGAQSFHQQLRVDELRCSILPNRAAVWRVKRTRILLSALAAVVLANEGLLSFSDLKLHRPPETEHTSFSVESALQSGKGVSRIVGAGMKVPMDVMLGLQRGFHNTSKLYGEEPRQVEKVTGFSSGLKVAGKEFGTGLYEGISGLITQPLKGAKEDGAGGFIKGVGKGIAGIALKPQAAAFAIPAYTMKGIYMGIRKPFGATIQNYIIAARTAQGWEEYNKSTSEERAIIVELYQFIASHVKKKRNPGEKEMEAIQALVAKRRAKAEEQRKSLQTFLGWRSAGEGSSGAASAHPTSGPAVPPAVQRTQNTYAPQNSAVGQSSSSQSPAPSQWEAEYDAATLQKAENDDLEEAIRLSLTEVSRGNPEEDALIERAMRNSIKEMEASNPHIHEQFSAEEEAEILQRVLEQSRLEAAEQLERGRADGGTGDDELEEALKRSRLDSDMKARRHHVNTDSEWDTDSSPASPPTVGEVDTGTLASHRSTVLGELESVGTERGGGTVAQGAMVSNPPIATGRQEQGVMDAQEEEDEELRKAVEASERERREREDAEEKARREEEIVLEYVKKQSLEEEAHRKRMLGGGNA